MASAMRFFLACVCVSSAITVHAEKMDAVWPKNKPKFSDSFLPPVLQVLSYLVLAIEDADLFQLASAPDRDPCTILQTTDTPLELNATTDSDAKICVEVPLTKEELEISRNTEDLPSSMLATTNLKPVVAYILLDTLKDTLSDEAKRRSFSRMQGYSTKVLEELVRTSSGTASTQLQTLMSRMLNNGDLKNRESILHAKTVLRHLELSTSALNTALHQLSISPLQYSFST